MTTGRDDLSHQAQPMSRTREGWLGVWALWIVLTAVGGLAGLGLAAYVESTAVFSNWLSWEIQTGIALTVVGAGMGLGQWLLLRRWVHQAWSWIVPTVAGQPLGWAAAVAVNWHYDAWVLISILSGVGQWLVLRRWVHRSWWWLIVAVSYAPLRWLIDLVGAEDVEVWGALLAFWGGVLVYGTPVALAGLALMLLFARSAKPGQLRSGTGTARPVFLRYLTTPPKPTILRYLWVMLMVVFGLVSGVALLIVGLILFVGLLFSGCIYHNTVKVTSPDGRYVVRSRIESCGGAIGDIDSRVTIRDTARPYLNVPGNLVVIDSLSRNLRIRWMDARTLVVEYNPAVGYYGEEVILECEDWRDVTIVCRSVTAVQQLINPVESILDSLERGEPTATVGVPGVFLALTTDEVPTIAAQWVGPDYAVRYNYSQTAYTLTSEDGLRVYHSPEIDPSAIRAGHSKTGRQAIFEQFSPADDKWQVVRVEVFDLEQHLERRQALLLALEAQAADTEPTARLRLGNRLVTLTAEDSLALGRQWVGGGPTDRTTADGVVWLVSADGEREYRGPRRVPDADANGATARMQATLIVNSPGQGRRREIRVDISSADQSVPAVPYTRPLFIETFDHPDAGQLPPSSPVPARFQAGYVGGEYAIRLMEPSGAPAKVDLPGTYLAASISVDARLVGETEGAFIIVGCRVNPTYHEEFRFMLDPGRGQYRYSRWVNGQDERPGNWEYHASINLDKETNRIGVYCGRVIGVDFNDAPPIQTVYEQIPEGIDRVSFKPEGGIWLGVGTIGERSTPVEARFDNLVVQDSQCFRPDDTRC